MRMLKEKYADQVKRLVKFNVDTLPETGTIDTKDQAIMASDDKDEAFKARQKADKKMQKDGDKNIEETADEQKKVEIAKKELPKEKGITEKRLKEYRGSEELRDYRTGWYPIDATEDTPWDEWKQMADDYGKRLKVEEPAILEIEVVEVEDRSYRDEPPRASYLVKFDKSLEQEAIRSLKARDMLFINPQGPEGMGEKVVKGIPLGEAFDEYGKMDMEWVVDAVNKMLVLHWNKRGDTPIVQVNKISKHIRSILDKAYDEGYKSGKEQGLEDGVKEKVIKGIGLGEHRGFLGRKLTEAYTIEFETVECGMDGHDGIYQAQQSWKRVVKKYHWKEGKDCKLIELGVNDVQVDEEDEEGGDIFVQWKIWVAKKDFVKQVMDAFGYDKNEVTVKKSK
jgi:hypothetical protein